MDVDLKHSREKGIDGCGLKTQREGNRWMWI